MQTITSTKLVKKPKLKIGTIYKIVTNYSEPDGYFMVKVNLVDGVGDIYGDYTYHEVDYKSDIMTYGLFRNEQIVSITKTKQQDL